MHERIIYEQLCEKINAGALARQRLLIPATIAVSDQDLQAIEEHKELLTKIGLEVEPFGPGTVAIQAFPAILAKADPAEFTRGLLDMLTDGAIGVDAEKLIHDVLDMAACKAAIKAGQSLTQEEMQNLLADKELIQRASRCPHGRPTVIKFSIGDLEKQFKRTGF